MKTNDFYEVDGCEWFIPVTTNKTYASEVGVKVHGTVQDYRFVVKEVYRFPKPQEQQKVVVPKFVDDWLKKYRHAHTLLRVLNAVENEQVIPSTVNDWILDNQYDFIKAWFDGYDIAKEEETDE